MEESRPVNRLKKSDYVFEWAGACALAGTLILIIAFYGRLPETIPVHFNASGVPDSYGSKASVWFLPSISLVLYAVLTLVNRFPHRFNFPVKVTPENEQRLYRIATRMIRSLKAILALVFLFITYTILMTVTGKAAGLGPWFLPVFLFLIVLIIGVSVFRMVRTR